MTNEPNLHFFMGRSNTTRPGFWMEYLQDPTTQKTIPSVVLGGVSRGELTQGSSAIPVDLKNQPEFHRDKASRGSVITQEVDGKKKKVLAAYQKDGMWYAIIRTGLKKDQNGGTTADLMSILGDDKEPVAFGSFSTDGGAVKIGAAKGIEIAEVAATRLNWSLQGKKIPSIDCPEYRHDLWEIPVGAAVLVGDIDGTMTRLVGKADRLEVRDADGYTEVFEALVHARRERNEADRQRNREAKAASQPTTAPTEVAAAPVEAASTKENKGGWLGGKRA